MIATATYTGVTLTGDTLIRGEPVNPEVLSATAVGSMVGNYAGQQAKEAYLQSQPKADTKQARKQKQAAESGRVNARAAQQRPLTVQDKQMQAAESIVDGQQALPDPVLDTGGANYQLSEMNRTRLQRWNNSLAKTPQAGSAAAELFRAAQVAGNGESYSFLDDASTMEKAAIYGAGAALALAALPEAAAGAAISLTTGALESLGYISMASASVGIPLAEGMLATEAATAVGGATLTGGASLAGKAYNNASRFFGRGGAGGESATFAPKIGDKVYRVWGDEAGSYGRSWTRTDPGAIPDYRNTAGLPDQNTGRFVSEGYLKSTADVTHRAAIPLHGNAGGLDEILVPNPREQIELTGVSGVNRPF